MGTGPPVETPGDDKDGAEFGEKGHDTAPENLIFHGAEAEKSGGKLVGGVEHLRVENQVGGNGDFGEPEKENKKHLQAIAEGGR